MLFASIEDWIQPQYLAEEAIKYLSVQFALSPMKILVIDNFLLAQRIADLKAVLSEAGKMEPRYAIYNQSKRVSETDWDAVSIEERFYNHLELVGPKPGFELSQAYLTHICFSDLITTDSILDYFSRISGESLHGVENLIGKMLSIHHGLRPHSDAAPGRRLCGVLYVSEDWIPEYGGQFLLHANGEVVKKIEPLYNRLLLFAPHTAYLHSIAPIQPAAKDWKRLNYSFWLMA